MRPRFREFAFSLRPYDQGWINYQQGIALRHISAKKNRVDVHLIRRTCGTVKQLRLNRRHGSTDGQTGELPLLCDNCREILRPGFGQLAKT